jgi:type IV fimbrial biogenesis protein FimT
MPGRVRLLVAGLTLVELLIAVALAGVLLGIAIPGYRDWIAGYQLANHAQQLAASMAYARGEALKRGVRVSLCRTTDGRQCAEGAGWDAGWIVYVDRNRNGRVDTDEPVLRVEPPAALGVRTEANRPVENYVSFTGSGHARLLNGGLQMGTFTVCRSGAPATRVVLANSGRVRTEKTREPCTD